MYLRVGRVVAQLLWRTDRRHSLLVDVVEEEHVGIERDGACQRCTLAHASADGRRIECLEAAQSHQHKLERGCFGDRPASSPVNAASGNAMFSANVSPLQRAPF